MVFAPELRKNLFTCRNKTDHSTCGEEKYAAILQNFMMRFTVLIKEKVNESEKHTHPATGES